MYGQIYMQNRLVMNIASFFGCTSETSCFAMQNICRSGQAQ
jgi:hypothetical protein